MSLPRSPSLVSGPGRILVVDDDVLARRVHAEALEAEGHEVVIAADGESAAAKVRAEVFDLAVTDVLMPGMDGLQLLDLIKRTRPEMDVIVLTSVDSVETAVTAMRAGAWHYQLKPVNVDALRLDVQRCLERRRVLRAHARLERHTALFELSRRISGTLELESLRPRSADALRQAAEADAVVLYEAAADALTPVACRGISEGHAAWLLPTLAAAHGEAFYEVDTPTRLADVGALIPARDARLRSLAHGLVAPLVYEERRLGVALLLRRKTAGPFDERHEADLGFLGGCVAMALSNASRFGAVRAQVHVDDLTGLPNAVVLEKRLDEALKGRPDDAEPISVLFMDLDRFKEVNDVHGHPVGSKVLAEAARLLQRHMRAEDLLVRYGGDEFVAVLDEADADAALHVAERIRRAVESHRFLAREGLELRLTLCIGVGCWPRHAATRGELLHAADVAMYHGKRSNRNAVYAFHEVDAATDRPKRFID